LTRLGVEYGVEIVNGWEAGVSVVWEGEVRFVRFVGLGVYV
jgi:hypothetical protein